MNWLNHTKVICLNPGDVNISDERYLVPSFDDLGGLIASIERVGILNSPLVQECSDGRLIPVLGRRRLQAAKAIGLRDVPARVAPDNLSIPDGFALAFWDNFTHRSFDEAIKAVVLARLFQLFPRAAVVSQFLPALRIPPKGPVIERLKAIGSLEPQVLRALADGRIHEKTAALLTKCLPEDRAAIMDFIELLALNGNKNAEIIANLSDISICSGRRISEIVKDHPIPTILCDENISMAERGKRIRDRIRTWKFPMLSCNEHQFHEWHRGLSIPPNATIRHAQAFESEECTVEIRVHSREEAAKVLERLSGLNT